MFVIVLVLLLGVMLAVPVVFMIKGVKLIPMHLLAAMLFLGNMPLPRLAFV